MLRALRLAEEALALKEVPVGCVIVMDNKIIAEGHNRRNTDKCALYHAEILAIKQASAAAGDWRLESCELYVTVEPCPMCAGAIVQARVAAVYFGAANPKAGCAGSIYNMFDEPRFNHRVHCEGGFLEDASAELLRRFFTVCRAEEKAKRTVL
jgi:tRNA(adenine34) deaminase